MALDRRIFFDGIRRPLFGDGLTQAEVDGIEDVLDEWERLQLSDDLRWLAYPLAGVYHETGGRMVPVREGFAATDAEARAVVARLYAQGRIKANYAKPVNGISYYGRGRIQNTHYDNYLKLEKRFGLPFVTQPDLLLDSVTDAGVTLIGHAEGLWTGRKLADYFNAREDDPFNARAIVNGDKTILKEGRKIGSLIEGYYRVFLGALRAAWIAPAKPSPGPVEPVPVDPAPHPSPAREGPLWTAYVALAAHFGDPPPKETAAMLPTAILAPIVTQLVTAGVQEAIRRLSADPNKPLTPYEPVQPADLPVITHEVTREVNAAIATDPRLREVDQRLTNATNSEPWYQSRVYLGLLTGLVGTIGAVAGFSLAPEDIDVIVGAIGGLIGIGGQLYAWYGRRKGAQMKPLGS